MPGPAQVSFWPACAGHRGAGSGIAPGVAFGAFCSFIRNGGESGALWPVVGPAWVLMARFVLGERMSPASRAGLLLPAGGTVLVSV